MNNAIFGQPSAEAIAVSAYGDEVATATSAAEILSCVWPMRREAFLAGFRAGQRAAAGAPDQMMQELGNRIRKLEARVEEQAKSAAECARNAQAQGLGWPHGIRG